MTTPPTARVFVQARSGARWLTVGRCSLAGARRFLARVANPDGWRWRFATDHTEEYQR